MNCGDSGEIIKCKDKCIEFTCTFGKEWAQEESRDIEVKMNFLSAKAKIKPYKVCTHVEVQSNGKILCIQQVTNTFNSTVELQFRDKLCIVECSKFWI